MVSVNQPSALTNKVSIDQVSSDGATVTVYARNTGSANVGIDNIYVEGVGGVVNIPMTPPVVIPAGDTSPISFPNTFRDGIYVIKLASAQVVLYA